MNSVVIDGAVAPLRYCELESPAQVPLREPVAGTRPRLSALRRLLAFVGPGYMVAVGYMDPGNWATSLGAGSAFGYSLLSVILLSNIMAMMLQAAAVRLGLASGLDLAQACRQHFSPTVSLALWLACEIAIVACNVAEVLGMACGLEMLFGIPLVAGVVITALDVMLVLQLQRRGVRHLEVFIIGLVSLIGACLAAQLCWLHPPAAAVARGFIPTSQIITRPEMLYLAVGIVGATVMPHNLYLHSSIVKTRKHESGAQGVRRAIRYATIDSNVALGLALFVNVAILVLAAGAFHRPGYSSVSELSDAYRLLSPVLGTTTASTLFGIGLVAAGLSSSITGTLAGQIVMEGFLEIRLSRPRRALLTRALAIVPAVAVAMAFGHAGVGKLLIFTQVVLGMQLPFAVVPLLWFTTRRRFLGVHAFRVPAAALLWTVALALIGINAWSLWALL